LAERRSPWKFPGLCTRQVSLHVLTDDGQQGLLIITQLHRQPAHVFSVVQLRSLFSQRIQQSIKWFRQKQQGWSKGQESVQAGNSEDFSAWKRHLREAVIEVCKTKSGTADQLLVVSS